MAKHINTQDERVAFLERVVKGEPMSPTAWFQFCANSTDCDPFPSGWSQADNITICLALAKVLPSFGPEYRAKGYPAIIDAIEVALLKKVSEIIVNLSQSNKNQTSTIAALRKEVKKLRFGVIPELKAKLIAADVEGVYAGEVEDIVEDAEGLTDEEVEDITRDVIKYHWEATGGNLKETAKLCGMTQTALRKAMLEYEIF